MEGGGRWGTDPSLLLAAFLDFCTNNAGLVRVALVGRDPFWARCDRKAAEALFGSIRNCIGARGCSDVWIEQLLTAFLFIARDFQRPQDGRPLTGWSKRFQELDPHSDRSAIGVLLHMLVMLAFQDSEGAAWQRGFDAQHVLTALGLRRCQCPGL
ncbi:MAG: hypothetical protein HY905_18645 [Deltaproteobacteria bacterium]|nr:hypothetical protein [Deltaproteobacteria bacterium]